MTESVITPRPVSPWGRILDPVRRYNLPLRPGHRGVSFLLLSLGVFVAACDGGSHSPTAHGAACGASVRCGGGLLCAPDPPFPGGYCTETCGEGGEGCTRGSVCTLLLGTQVCLAPCSERSECRSEYQCWMGTCRPDCLADPASCGPLGTCGADGQCTGPECTTDMECGAGRRCDGGRCMDIPPPVDAGPVLLGTGEPCVVDAQCDTGLCLPPARGGSSGRTDLMY